MHSEGGASKPQVGGHFVVSRRKVVGATASAPGATGPSSIASLSLTRAGFGSRYSGSGIDSVGSG